MKKRLTGLTKLTAGCMIAAGVIACNNKNEPKSAAETVASRSENAAGQSIVYVNSDTLLTNYEYFKDIKGKIETKSKQAQSDLQAKGTAFQQEVAEYQKAAQGMSADQRATTEQRLARKQQELSAYNQNASSALANEQAAENEKLYNKVADYLKGYAKEKGYKFVLTYSKSNPSVLFADESLDVTKDVVTGLNEAYKKDKK